MADGELYYSIKEFARYTGVRQSVLRYYDEIGLFAPARRGENGYRYYTPYQVVPLNMIKVFIDLSTPLREIEELRVGRTPERVLGLLARQERLFDEGLRRLQRSYSVTHLYRALITRGTRVDETAIEERVLDAVPLFLGPQIGPEEGAGERGYASFGEYCRAAKNCGVSLSYPVGRYYEDFAAFRAEPERPQRYFSLCPSAADRSSAGCYLIGFARGPYGQFGDLPERLAAYAKERTLTPCGPVYVLYLIDEISTRDPDSYLAQAAVPVTAKRLRSGK
jgi:DNA-binding transcriptional MerR regulator